VEEIPGLRSAAAALPFEHPKLAVVARVSSEDMQVRLERALQATAKVISSRPMKVIEPPKAKAPQFEPLDHSGPFVGFEKNCLGTA